MSDFIERLQYFMAQEGINDNQMTVAAGLSVGLLGKAKVAGKGMSSINIEKILLAYPELSADWLLTGNGDMLKSKCSESNLAYKPSFVAATSIGDKGTENIAKKQEISEKNLFSISDATAPLLDMIREKDALIRQQAEEIGKLRERVCQLEEGVSDAPPATAAHAG